MKRTNDVWKWSIQWKRICKSGYKRKLDEISWRPIRHGSIARHSRCGNDGPVPRRPTHIYLHFTAATSNYLRFVPLKFALFLKAQSCSQQLALITRLPTYLYLIICIMSILSSSSFVYISCNEFFVVSITILIHGCDFSSITLRASPCPEELQDVILPSGGGSNGDYTDIERNVNQASSTL